MKKIKVGVFFGGVSPEHEVSIISASGVMKNIDRDKFDIVEVFIDNNGVFWSGEDVLERIKNKRAKSLKKLDLNNLLKKIDVAFPVLHGEGGEDGSIQGFFRTLGIPFVGADILASAVCLDKAIFNELMVYNNLPKTKFINFDFEQDTSGEIASKMQEIEKLKLPLFIKSSTSGSSIGVYKVKNLNEIEKYLDMAKEYGSRIVVEEAVDVLMEIEVAVFGNSIKDFKVSLPGSLKAGGEFYDYEEKYFNNKTEFEIPIKLGKEKIKQIQRLALKAYRVSGCEGLARVDFFMDRKERIFLNEINTLPGFTPSSMYPKLWEASGVNYNDLITKLIELAL